MFLDGENSSAGITILKHQLRHLEHVLFKPSHMLPHRALFDDVTGWDNMRGGQFIT